MAALLPSPALPLGKQQQPSRARSIPVSNTPPSSRFTPTTPDSLWISPPSDVRISLSSSSRRSLGSRVGTCNSSPPGKEASVGTGQGVASAGQAQRKQPPHSSSIPVPLRQTLGFNASSSPVTGFPVSTSATSSSTSTGGLSAYAASEEQQSSQPFSFATHNATAHRPAPSRSSSNVVPGGGLSKLMHRASSSNTSREQPAAATTSSAPARDASSLLDAGKASTTAPTSTSDSTSFFPGVDTSLLRDLQERHSIFHSELVANAFLLAAKAHDNQCRRDGSSQLSHSVLVGLQLAQLGLDAECVAAGLLHEVLRNHNPALESQMEEFMPSSVMQLVNRVTAISEISCVFRNNRDKLTDEKWRRMLLAMEDVKAVLIKLTCRVHDMRTCGALPRDRQISLAMETLDIFSVVANRLGIWCLKADLEDLAFSVIHPEEHAALSKEVAQRQDAEALEATITRIKAGLDARGVQYEDISGRPKNLYGIWQKMRSSGKTSLDQVYDVTALRVVVTNKHDCYVALRVVQELYRMMPERSKDYIRGERKPNGYQSLHETIYGEGNFPVEVQFRTHKMHYIAEYGFAAHWKYKEKLSNEDEWLDKEVQYKKWLTMYKLGVHDKKVRPSGAPLQDCALKSLGVHLLHGADQNGGPYGDGSVSGAEQPGVDPFLRHDRFRLRAPTKASLNVVVQTQDGIDTRELAVGMTAGQLGEELGVPQLPCYVLTVNARVAAPNTQLRSGDLIQVQPAKQVISNMRCQARSSDETQTAGPPQHAQAQLQQVQQQQAEQAQQQQQQQQGQEQEQLVFLPGSPVPVRVVLPPNAAQRKAENHRRVYARQRQRVLQRRAEQAAQQQQQQQQQEENEQLVYLPDSPIPMRVVLPSSSSLPSFGLGGSFLANILRGGGKGRRASMSNDTRQTIS